MNFDLYYFLIIIMFYQYKNYFLENIDDFRLFFHRKKGVISKNTSTVLFNILLGVPH